MKFWYAENSVTSKTLICYITNWLFTNKIIITEANVQILAYMIYGFYLATTGERIVKDEVPRAFPSWPVFMHTLIIFKTINSIIEHFSNYKIDEIKDNELKKISINVLNTYWNWDQKKLVSRSYLDDSPRTKTRKEKCIGTNRFSDDIDDELTYNYFINGSKNPKEPVSIDKRVNFEWIETSKFNYRNISRKAFEEKSLKNEGITEKISQIEDTQKQLEKMATERQKQNTALVIQEKNIQIQSLKDTNIFRWIFVARVITIVTVFLAASIPIIISPLINSDSIKITLLSSTTATIIWLPLVIVKWLFKKKED